MNKKQRRNRQRKVRGIQAKHRKINLALEQVRLRRQCREVFGKEKTGQESGKPTKPQEMIDLTFSEEGGRYEVQKH